MLSSFMVFGCGVCLLTEQRYKPRLGHSVSKILAAPVRRTIATGRFFLYAVRVQYSVVLIQSAEGFAVSCPVLPGCHSQGATKDEALTNIREAISLWLEVAEEDTRRALL